MTIHLFNAGLFYADGGAMFGAVPRTAWGRRYEADHQNRCVLAMQIGLVATEGRLVLIDTGVGTKHLERLSRSYYAFHQLADPADVLTRLGFTPDDVTDVILTHLHFDHCGGTTRLDDQGRIVPTYPRARVHVSRAQLDACAAPNALEEDSFSTDHIDAIRQAGLLSPIDTPETLIHPLIRLTLHDGHTDGQIAVRVDRPDGKPGVLFPGDVVPTSAHLSPTWISAYDIRPLDSYREKCRLLDEASEEQLSVVFCHDVRRPVATVRKTKDFYSASPTPSPIAHPDIFLI